jgi:hypothetical protein
MTHTTTPAEIHRRVPPISSSLGSSERRRQLWIYLYWIMLSLAVEEPILSAAGTIVLGRQGYFNVLGLNLSIFMVLWLA